MPELPDVEGFRRYMVATVLHKRIIGVDVGADRLLEVSRDRLRKTLTGTALAGTHRHGKWLLAALNGDAHHLALHFGMTGGVRYCKDPGDAPDHTQLRLDFDNDYHFAYVNTRKLGAISLADSPESFVEAHDVGPDAMRLSRDEFLGILSDRRGSIKGALMNQEVIAGLGNVWTDEVLFQAGIHPKATVADLGEDRLKNLYRVMRRVLRVGIREAVHGGGFPDGYLRDRRGEGEPCPRCGGTVEKVTISGRSGYVCPQCQSE